MKKYGYTVRKDLIEPALLAGLVLSAFLAWFVLYRAVIVPGSSVWAVPITAFSVLLVVIFMSAVLAGRPARLAVTLAASLLSSLFFAPTLLHFSLLLPALALAIYGVRNIRHGLRCSIKLSFFDSLMHGRSYLVYALVIVITSQYYALVGRTAGDVNLPIFKIDREVTLSLGKLYGHVNPKYSFFSSAREMTVDKFILHNQRAALDAGAAGRPDGTAGAILAEGRRQLSELAGRELSGGEQVSDVFADFVTAKINDYFSAGLGGSGGASPIPLLLTCVLFLTLLPLSAIFGYAGTVFSSVLCGFLLKKGFIRSKSLRVQAESLELGQ
ncbi:MAG TPA: hypothetical protein PK523_10625 [Elusimicrobiales bacterium]|nr:hypothetical protein [Elusimicrobiales bacterium]